MTEPTNATKVKIKATALTFSIARLTGGLYFSVRQLCRGLLHEHVDSDVITLEGGWGERLTQQELDDWAPLNVRIFPCCWPRKLGYSPKILPALREIAPDVVHCHGLWHYHLVAASKYCRQNRIPWVVSPHGMLDNWALHNKAWRKRVADRLYHHAATSNASCLRALCEAEANSIRQSGFNNPICVIPNGVDLPDERQEARPHPPAASWADGKRILLFLGRIAPKKGLVNLLHAWRKTQLDSKLAKDWVLIIAGMDEGNHEAELRRTVQELGLGQKILFPGQQYGPAKTSLLLSASAFILPSYSEGLPMGVLDAWAHRLPALITPHCNVSEGVAAGGAIPILPTTESIQHGLSQMFEMSAGQLAEMGAKGRRLVSERFTWSRVASQMRDVYDWILGRGSAPTCVQFS